MKKSTNRRGFLLGGMGAAGALIMTKPLTQAIAAEICGLTPPQTPGPFYPGETKFHPDNDLTQMVDRPRAKGQVVYIKGKVMDLQCKPLAGANVEIWQACISGKYNSTIDPNPAPIDENFKYWGETFTDENGEYMFKTIIPGAYPADTDWTRPPHIHYKITKLGYKELVTQMYFKGNEYNDADLILQAIPANERDSVIVDFKPSPADLEPDTLMGVFDITLQKVRR